MNEMTVEHALVVEDDPALRRTLTGALGRWATEVHACADVASALAEVSARPPGLAVLDFKLPDGDAREVLRAMQARRPWPAVVAVSAYAAPAEAFELAALGVRAYLEKPLDLEAFERAVDAALEVPPDLRARVRGTVGHVGLHAMQTRVREEMIDEAMARGGGSRRRAARLLQVSRQVLQHALRGRRERDPE